MERHTYHSQVDHLYRVLRKNQLFPCTEARTGWRVPRRVLLYRQQRRRPVQGFPTRGIHEPKESTIGGGLERNRHRHSAGRIRRRIREERDKRGRPVHVGQARYPRSGIRRARITRSSRFRAV